MDDRLIKLIMGLILFGLAGYLVMMVVIQTGQTYDKDIDAVTGGTLDIEQFNVTIKNFQTDAMEQKDAFDKSDEGKESILDKAGDILSTIGYSLYIGLKITTGVFNMLFLPFEMVRSIFVNIFHVPSIVADVIQGLLIFAIIFGVYQLIKQGS